ncbi:MAG TPA: aliphatic sulfonate ABC transporter substrate-binding protein [Thermoanaerobacterales bacterium]|nr:aliphatic sulfonate ABC transporter substrate-binding protein [Thermoanaerobacterales bacterium]
MKKTFALLLVFLVIMTALSGCGTGKEVGAPEKTSQSSEKPAVDVINISYVKLPLNVPSIVEKKLELFEEEFGKDGIKVNFPEITEGPKMTEAIAAGSLDFCNALGGTSAILAAANGVDLKVIGIYSRAPKAFTIMTKDDGITSIKELKGKKIAGPKGTILHQLLLAALAQNEMSIEDVEYINMSIPQAVAAMNSDNVDVALVAGPAVPQAIYAGGRIITTGEGLLDATIVIAVRNDFLKQYPKLVKRYMEVHNKSLQYIREHPDEVYKIAAEETGISEDNVVKMIDWYDFNPTITQKDIVELEKTQDFLIENDMLKKKIKISDIIRKVE